jgi:hypothetical protein
MISSTKWNLRFTKTEKDLPDEPVVALAEVKPPVVNKVVAAISGKKLPKPI